MTEHDLEEPARVLPLLERPGQQRLEVAVDRGQRRPQLVRDVGHELGADLLEPPQLGDVVQDHDHADLVGRQAERHRVHLHPPLDRVRQV